MEALIEVRNVRKVYPNGHEALKDISFAVPTGQLTAIIGRGGAGKSTLLRCLNGIIRATSGQISVRGVAITEVSPRQRMLARRRIGFVYQETTAPMTSCVRSRRRSASTSRRCGSGRVG